MYRDYLLRYHLCSSKATRLCASGLQGPFVALAVFVAATLACVFALDRIVSALCILSDKNPGALRATSCVRAKRVFAFAAAGCGECLHCADIMPRAAQNMGALPKTALGCGGSLAVLSSCSSSWGAPCSRLRPDRRYAGVCAMRTARFPISCGMFSIAVLDLPTGPSVTSTLWRCKRLPCRQRHSVSPIWAAVVSLQISVEVF